MKTIKHEMEYAPGVVLSGMIIKGDWEGDPDVPGGARIIEPYVDDLEVIINGVDRYHWLNDACIDEMCIAFVEHWESR